LAATGFKARDWVATKNSVETRRSDRLVRW
jgi:hypothetical protein